MNGSYDGEFANANRRFPKRDFLNNELREASIPIGGTRNIRI